MKTVLLVDGRYARTEAAARGGKLDFHALRGELEELMSTEFEECWYFDTQQFDTRGDDSQFLAQVPSLIDSWHCPCTECVATFTLNSPAIVRIGIATKIVELTTDAERRVVLFSGDGVFCGTLHKEHNRLNVLIAGFRGTVACDLHQEASRVIWVDEMRGLVTHGHGRRCTRR
jgi:hypothetical protein